jgi:chemotaxis-related protein WspB
LRLEYATETLRCDPAEFVDSGVDTAPARYLGPVRSGSQGMVQWIKVDALLTGEAHARLFPDLPAKTAEPGP